MTGELELGPKTTQIIRTYAAVSFLVGGICGAIIGTLFVFLTIGIWTLYQSL